MYNPTIYHNEPDIYFFNQRYSFNDHHVQTINSFYDKIFQHYSKITPIRIDFSLQKAFVHEYDYDEIRKLFNRLMSNMRHNQLFEHHIAHISRLEFGQLTGWHFHVLFIFNGQYVQQDYVYANKICRYWEEVVTKGQGRAYSPNMDAHYLDKYDEAHMALGGYINHFDNLKINALMNASYYLAKQTQLDSMAKQQAAPKARFFNASQIKTAEGNRRGRPRKRVEYAENPELATMLRSLRAE